MSRREKLGWNVSASVFEDHREWAREEYGKTEGKYAIAVEDAMREFMDADPYAEVEDVLDDVLDTLSLDGGAKKREVDGHPVGGQTRTVGHRVDVDLKAGFRRFAVEEVDSRPGVALSHALHEHCPYGGGRNRRTRVLDNVKDIQSWVEGSSATSGEEKRAAIVDQLGEAFRLSEFLDAAETVGVLTRKYAIKNYLPHVLDRTETVPHPGNPRRFIPRSATDAPETPNPAYLPYYAMTDDEKRVALQVAGVRKAWSKGGKARLTVEEGVDTLSGVGSPRHKTVRSGMREAATFDGFRFDGEDEPVLKVYTDDLDTHGLATVLAIASKEIQVETDAVSPDDGETGETEGGGRGEIDANPGFDKDEPGSVASRLDALDAASRETVEWIETGGEEP